MVKSLDAVALEQAVQVNRSSKEAEAAAAAARHSYLKLTDEQLFLLRVNRSPDPIC